MKKTFNRGCHFKPVTVFQVSTGSLILMSGKDFIRLPKETVKELLDWMDDPRDEEES